MKKTICFLLIIIKCSIFIVAQTLEIRSQFGHDPLWGNVSEDGKYAVTASRNSIVLWELSSGNVIIEQPFRCMAVQFVNGFPYYCVAADLVREDGSLDSSGEIRTVINLLTGKQLFKIEEDLITNNKQSVYQLSIPFDSLGRFEVNDHTGLKNNKIGGKLPGGISNVEISSDGQYLLVAGKHPVVWDLNKMKIFSEIPLSEYYTDNHYLVDAGLDILPLPATDFNFKSKAAVMKGWRQFFKAHFIDENNVLAGTPGGDICIYSVTGELQKVYKTEPQVSLIYDCSMVGQTIFATTANSWTFIGKSTEDSLHICKPSSENEKRFFKITYEILTFPDKDSFICTTDGWILFAGSITHPEKGLDIINIDSNGGDALSITKIDNDNILLTRTGGKYSFLNLNTKEVSTYKWNGVIADIQSCLVISDGRIIIGGDDGRVGIINKGDSIITRVVTYGFGQIRGFAEDILRSRIYVSSSDGAIRVLDRETLSLIATCFNLGDMNSIIYTPDGYYSADKEVTNLIMYGNGLDLFSFDRFDLVKNRPDIIAKRLGGTDQEIALLERVYMKRLRRMGLDEEIINETKHLPDIAITRFPTNQEITSDYITLSIQCKDNKYPIQKIFIWLNGTPILGRNGMTVNGYIVTHNIPIQLASGENHIEVSCINSVGIESLRINKSITYVKPNVEKNLYIISLGVSSYNNESYNLHYAAKDAEDINLLFQQNGNGLYNNIYNLNLIDQSVNLETPSKIRDFLSNASRDDVVLLFYAGHGLIDKNYDYYLSTYLTDFNNPEISAIKYEDFEKILDNILPLKKLIFIDACHSGELDKEDLQLSIKNVTAKGEVIFRGVSIGTESEESQILSAQFNDIRRDQGATILVGSKGVELAVEGDEWNNGLFTWAIRRGLEDMAADENHDNKVTVSEIIRFTSKEVIKASQGKQSPETRKINPSCDFVIKELVSTKRKD